MKKLKLITLAKLILIALLVWVVVSMIPVGFIERRIKEHNYIQCMRDGHGQGTCEFLVHQVK